MKQYTMTQAMEYFGMTNTVRLMWVPENEFGPNHWLDTTTGEVVPAHEPSKPDNVEAYCETHSS